MDPIILITILTGAISTLFGLLVTEWRAKDKAQKERIEKLETQLSARDTVIEKNTDTLGEVTKTTAAILNVLQDAIIEIPEKVHHAADRAKRSERD